MSANLPNTMAGLRAALLANELSVTDAVQRQSQHFDRVGAATHAVIAHLPVAARKPDLSRPLEGIGLAHKDIFDLTDRRPGLGRDRGDVQPGLTQAWVLSELEQAGALNLGTLAMAEDACSATGQTDQLPTPLNPLDEALAVGGSSSGSGVAVASGMVYASLGTDTAGSVRIPAMTCGVMGLKTTHSLINRQGMALLCPSLDSIGVLARSIDDLGSVLQVLAPDSSTDKALPADQLKTGYWLDGIQVQPDIEQVIAPVMRHYGQKRLNIAEHERRAKALQELVMAFEVGQTQRARIAAGQACRQVMGLGTLGLTIPHAWWQGALQERSRHLEAFATAVFGEVDVLLAPLQTDLLPKTSEVYLGQAQFQSAKLLGLHQYCGWVNYLGLPALSMPIGLDAAGLPISIQLIAKPFHEAQLLALGRKIQNDIHGEQGIMPVLKIEGQPK